MGVKNLWKLFSPSKYKEPKNTTLGVDISAWLYQLNNTNILYNTFYRIIKLINNSNKPYFVFDGQPSFLKKLVLQKRKERRKENEFNNFVSNIVNNRICKCKKLFRKCEHGSTKNEEYFSDLIKDVKFALKKHNFNWGKNYSSKDKIDLESKLFNLRNKKSKKEKLNCLLKLRELRSVFDYKSDECLEEFSAKQIENVKKRNKVLEMINQLERNKIMSDCKKIFYLREEKKESEEESELVFSDEDVLSEKNEELPTKSEDNKKFTLKSEENEEFLSKSEEKNEESLSKIEDNEKSLLKSEDKDEFLLKSQENQKSLLKSEENEKLPLNNEEKNVFSSKNNEKFVQSENKEFLENEINDLQSESNSYNSEKEDDSQSEKESLKSSDELQSEKNDKNLIKEPKDKSIILNEINLLYVSALDTIKQVISSFNLPIIQSITESDAQLAYMNNTGIVNHIISDDNDIFVYNGKSIYRNYFTSSPSLYFLPLKEDYQLFLIKLAHLLGCDYSVGIKNVGLSKALKIVNSVKDEEIRYLKEIYCNSPVVEIKEYSFKVSKSKVVECFLKMGGSKEDSFKIKGLLEKCDCEYLEE